MPELKSTADFLLGEFTDQEDEEGEYGNETFHASARWR
jgi:hypothetical protein